MDVLGRRQPYRKVRSELRFRLIGGGGSSLANATSRLLHSLNPDESVACHSRASLVIRFPRPDDASEALVRVIKSGICNTDLEIARGYAGLKETIGMNLSAPSNAPTIVPSWSANAWSAR